MGGRLNSSDQVTHKKMKALSRSVQTTVLVLVVVGGAGCTSADSESVADFDQRQGVVSVFVVNYPLKYFAERIGGELVDVQFPVPPGEDPAKWLPDSAAISQCQQAELILLNGASYAGLPRLFVS